MQNIEELSHIEREFEDLQGLIKQHFSSLQELDEMQSQLHALQHFQEFTQTASQNTTEVINRIESAQRKLNERTDQLEIRLQKLSNQFSQLHQNLSQRLGEAGAWTQQQDSIKAEIKALEQRLNHDLKQEMEDLDKANTTFAKHLQDLEIRFNRLYGIVKEINERMRTSFKSMVLVGSLGFVVLFFAIPYFFLNR